MNRQQQRRRSLLLWFWICLVSASLALICWRLGQEAVYRVERQAWEQAQPDLKRLAKQNLEEMRTLYRSQSFKPGNEDMLSMKELADRINYGKPFKVINRNGQQVALWTHPASGRRYRFNFTDNRWTGYGSNWSSGSGLGSQRPVRPESYDKVRKMGRWFAGSFSLALGTVAWLIALVLCLAWKTQRRLFAQVMMALTVLCCTAWLTAHALTINGIFSNDMLFWGVIMFVMSLVALIKAYQSPAKPAWPVCGNCEYNLTGNVSGTCPECGEPVSASSQQACRAPSIP